MVESEAVALDCKKNSFPFIISPNDDNEFSSYSLHGYFGCEALHLPLAQVKVIQTIDKLFDNWESWQKKVFFSGLVDRFSKSQLKSLSVAVESVFHRDFVAKIKCSYPMKKVQETVEEKRLRFTENTQLYASKKRELNKFRGKTVCVEKSADNSQLYVKKTFPPIELPELVRPAKPMNFSSSSTSSENETKTSSIEASPIQLKQEKRPFKNQTKAASRKVSSATSFPSLYTFGNSRSTIDDTDLEINSQVSQLNLNVEDFFPSAMNNTRFLGRVVTTQSKSRLGHFMTKFDMKRNKMPLPTSKQLHKNEKFWSYQHAIVNSDTVRLKELFHQQIIQIWDWLSGWEEYKRVRLLIHLLSLSSSAEIEFFANCIKRKIEEDEAQKALSNVLTEECWMKIFEYLDPKDISSLGRVCKSWKDIVDSDDVWINKCNELGLKFGISNFEEQIKHLTAGNETLNWRHVYIELRRRVKNPKSKLVQYSRRGKKERGKRKEFFIENGNFDELDGWNSEEAVSDQVTEDILDELQKKQGGMPIRKITKDTFKENSNEPLTEIISSKRIATDPKVHMLFSSEDPLFISGKKAVNYVPFWKSEKKKEKVFVKIFKKPLKLYAAPSRSSKVDVEDMHEETDNHVETKCKSVVREKQSQSTKAPKEPIFPGSKFNTTSGPYNGSFEVNLPEKPPSIHLPPLIAKNSGFLQIWKNITTVVMETTLKEPPESETKKFGIHLILPRLLSDKEVDKFSQKTDEFFAVDNHVVDENGEKESDVPPICKVIAMQGHHGSVFCILTHGEKIMSGGLDRNIRLWHWNGDCYGTMEHCLKGGVICLAIGADEKCKTLYVGSWDYTISIFDSISFKRVDMLTGHTDTVSGIAVDGHYIISCSLDGSIRIWDIFSHQCMRVIKHNDKAIHCMDYCDEIIATGGADRLIHVTDASNGNLMKILRGHLSYITALQRRGDLIVSGDFEGYVLLWSLEGSETPTRKIKAHASQINGITIHLKRFFTASDDRLVKEWSITTGKCVRILQGHTMAVTGVKYADNYLVTCSKDGSVRTWIWST